VKAWVELDELEELVGVEVVVELTKVTDVEVLVLELTIGTVEDVEDEVESDDEDDVGIGVVVVVLTEDVEDVGRTVVEVGVEVDDGELLVRAK
jgi:hypothetical protein